MLERESLTPVTSPLRQLQMLEAEALVLKNTLADNRGAERLALWRSGRP